MAYADFEFYAIVYHGNVVPEADFPRIADRASEEIDDWTNKRLRKWLPDDEDDISDIRKATCVLADSIYRQEQVLNAGMMSVDRKENSDGSVTGRIVTSRSAGSESIGYSASGATSSSIEGGAVQSQKEEAEKRAIRLLSGIRYKDKNYSILFMGAGYE